MQLSVRGDDLPDRQPADPGTFEAGPCEAPPARPLGREPCAIVCLGTSQPGHQARRPRRHLHGRPGSRRARSPRPGIPRGHVLRDLSGQERRPRRSAEVLQAVLVPRPHRFARNAGDSGIHSRGRRAWLQPLARLRRGFRQPRSDRRLRGRGRRSGNWSARDCLALRQVHQPGPGRGGAADPEPQRLQDREPDRSRPHQPRGARVAVRGLRLHALFRRRLRPRRDASAHGCDARHHRCRDSGNSEAGARKWRGRAAALADDRVADAEGLDRTEGSRWPQGRRLLARAPGALFGRSRRSCQAAAARVLAAQLRARSAVRPGRPIACRTAGAGPRGPPAHERQSARQRRRVAKGAEAPGLPRLRREGRAGRQGAAREHEAA